jgi:alpha-tubulin suppressor-like RCC1 family protein
MRISAGKCVVQVECGGRHSVAVLDSGQLLAWGNSKRGALGGGLAEEVVRCVYDWGQQCCGGGGEVAHHHTHVSPPFCTHSIPRPVEATEGKRVRAVACGKRHCAALVLHAWIPDEESPHWCPPLPPSYALTLGHICLAPPSGF